MPLVPMHDSLIGPPVGLVRQIRREGTRSSYQNSNCSPSNFLVTDLELDGNDLGSMINYMKEILFDDNEKHFNRRVLSKSNCTRSGHRHRHVSTPFLHFFLHFSRIFLHFHYFLQFIHSSQNNSPFFMINFSILDLDNSQIVYVPKSHFRMEQATLCTFRVSPTEGHEVAAPIPPAKPIE